MNQIKQTNKQTILLKGVNKSIDFQKTSVYDQVNLQACRFTWLYTLAC